MGSKSGVIGVFDSGMGGLTVLAALRQQLPEADLLYLGDTARLPYGTKSATTVINYATRAVELLVARGVKMVVVACNTASALALPALSARLHPLPVIGVVEPGARAALAGYAGSTIGVIATEATVAHDAYAAAIRSLNPALEVLSEPAQLLVALAEEGWADGEIAAAVLRRYIDPLVERGVTSLVLGCTHFPVFERELARLYPQLRLIDSARATAAEVAGLHGGAGAGSTRFMVTDGRERFERVGALFWPYHLDGVELVDL